MIEISATTVKRAHEVIKAMKILNLKIAIVGDGGYFETPDGEGVELGARFPLTLKPRARWFTYRHKGKSYRARPTPGVSVFIRGSHWGSR